MVNDDWETKSYEFKCWDPDKKLEVQDVYTHMGDALEQMYRVFNVESKDQLYQLEDEMKAFL